MLVHVCSFHVDERSLPLCKIDIEKMGPSDINFIKITKNKCENKANLRDLKAATGL